MLYGMRLVLPDVTGLAVEGTLMRSWKKEAEPLIHPKYKTTLIWEDCAAQGWLDAENSLKIPDDELHIKVPRKAI
jgi:hypothetical protein